MKTSTTIINFVHDASIMIHLMCFYDVLPQWGGVPYPHVKTDWNIIISSTMYGSRAQAHIQWLGWMLCAQLIPVTCN